MSQNLSSYHCPFNYSGSKSAILPILSKYYRQSDDYTFVDLFAGAFSVGVNSPYKKLIYNDINQDLTSLIKFTYSQGVETFINRLKSQIANYDLTKENADAYYQLRSDFNKTRDTILFALLIYYSFNHQIRYNQSGDFNTPFGKNRSSFNSNSEKKLHSFYDLLIKKDVKFYSLDFEDVQIPNNPFVFIDPPYLITTGSYNDGNRGVSSWNESQEIALYNYIDNLDKKGVPFVLTNALSNDTRVNTILKNWQSKYSVEILDSQFKNYHRKQGSTSEVIVTNIKSLT